MAKRRTIDRRLAQLKGQRDAMPSRDDLDHCQDLMDQIQEEREAIQDIWEKDDNHITGAEVIDLSVSIWAIRNLSDQVGEILGTSPDESMALLAKLADGNRRRGSL